MSFSGKTACLALVLAVLTVPAVTQQTYTIVDLGTLGGTYSSPTSINLLSDVAGISYLTDDWYYHAFLYHRGGMLDLATFGGDSSWTGANNNFNAVAGGAETTVPDVAANTFYCGPAQCHAALWTNGLPPRDLGTLPGGLNSSATSMNDLGQVVGNADITTTLNDVNWFLDFHAFVWQNGRMRDLGTLRTGHASTANGINNLGHVTGASQVNNFVPDMWAATGHPAPPFHAYLWSNGKMTDLHPAGNGWGDESIGVAVNNLDQIAGIAFMPDDRNMHAVLWTHGVMRDLGVLPGDSFSQAWGINDFGAVVGLSFSRDTYVERPVLWAGGRAYDLSAMVPPDSDLIPVEADAINIWGQIAGIAYSLSTGESHAVILNPHFGTTMQAPAPAAQAKRALPPRNINQQPETRTYRAAGK